jgi:hypothetical protein
MVLGGMVRVTIQGVRLGFFPVNLTFTLGTATTGAFAGLEVLLFFEAGFLVVTVEARWRLGAFLLCLSVVVEGCEVFFGLLSAKTHRLLSVSRGIQNQKIWIHISRIYILWVAQEYRSDFAICMYV